MEFSIAKVSTRKRVGGTQVLPLLLALLIAFFMATSARAQNVFTPPEGCTGFLTVQARNCSVSNYYKCAADPAGHQWRADFEVDGVITYLGLIDAQAQWIESYDFFPSNRDVTELPASDPMMFDELSKNGLDSFDFQQRRDDGRVSRVTGMDRLTGKTIIIDGQPLLETEFVARETHLDGTLIYEARGSEFIHLEFRNFFAGRAVVTLGGEGGEFQRDGTPIDFIFPGEDGFFSPNPEYDCETILSGLTAPGISPTSKEQANDNL